MLQAGVPIRITASCHDTSTAMIEANYSAHIVAHSDAMVRNTLPDLSPPADNVIPLPVGRVP
jgi:hypothetical protein